MFQGAPCLTPVLSNICGHSRDTAAPNDVSIVWHLYFINITYPCYTDILFITEYHFIFQTKYNYSNLFSYADL